MRANYGGRYDKKEKSMDKSTKQMVEKLIDATFAGDMKILSQQETQQTIKKKGEKKCRTPNKKKQSLRP